MLALWLTRLGARVKIIDKTLEPGTTSRALAVQARTLEFYDHIDLVGQVVEGSRVVSAVNLWVTGRRVAHSILGDMGAGISPYPFALIFPQDEHERLLIDRLAEVGVHVERRTELVNFKQASGCVQAYLKRSDGSLEICSAAYLAGCDGAHSTVREVLNIGFPGGTYTHLFYVADVDATGDAANGEIHVALDRTDFLVVSRLRARDTSGSLVRSASSLRTSMTIYPGTMSANE